MIYIKDVLTKWFNGSKQEKIIGSHVIDTKLYLITKDNNFLIYDTERKAWTKSEIPVRKR